MIVLFSRKSTHQKDTNHGPGASAQNAKLFYALSKVFLKSGAFAHRACLLYNNALRRKTEENRLFSIPENVTCTFWCEKELSLQLTRLCMNAP
jgi:hypothetical protein